MEILGGKTKAGQHLLDAGMEGIPSPSLELMLERAVARQGLVTRFRSGHLGLKFFQFPLTSNEVGKNGKASVPNGASHLKLGLLRQVSDPDGFGTRNRPARGFIQPDQDAQERGLAAAVGSHQRQARAFWDGKRDTGEQVQRAEGFGEVVGSDKRHEAKTRKKKEVGSEWGKRARIIPVTVPNCAFLPCGKRNL